MESRLAVYPGGLAGLTTTTLLKRTGNTLLLASVLDLLCLHEIPHCKPPRAAPMALVKLRCHTYRGTRPDFVQRRKKNIVVIRHTLHQTCSFREKKFVRFVFPEKDPLFHMRPEGRLALGVLSSISE